MNEYILLLFRRTLPDDGEPLIRNEGVNIVLDLNVPLLHGRMLLSVGRL